MIAQWLGRKTFSAIHQRNLVYNTCWEDPRLDRQTLGLSEQDRVLVITSAGCNALSYALDRPQNVFAVDMNPLQNALLQLKLAAIRHLSFEDFFQVFGLGQHAQWSSLYQDRIRPNLAAEDQAIWDKRVNFFDGTSRRRSFYFRGTTGLFAWMINGYVDRSPQLRQAIDELLQAPTVEHQREIFSSHRIDELLWSKPLRWALRRDTTMAMLGVPRSQRAQIDRCYPGGISRFIQDRIEHVFKNLPLQDNYFWRVYLTGQYSRSCCPDYLVEENFNRLKAGLVDRISTYTSTVEDFLSRCPCSISRFVLLDHMDWLYQHFPAKLTSEWQAILQRATPDARVLWRSAALQVDFVDPLIMSGVNAGDQATIRLGQMLRYQTELASRLHEQDRVHTYGSFYIADIVQRPEWIQQPEAAA